jgi:predicted O-methyltransferase YrrM
MQITINFENHPGAIDLNHNLLLMGAVMSKKPETVLELGIGTGLASWSILTALKYNERGRLVCVDNWHDSGGIEPGHVAPIRQAGAEIVVSDEESFVKSCPSDSFDLLVSDADHTRSGLWLEEHLRIVKDNGFLFFHDTNNPAWPTLHSIPGRVSHLPHHHFTENSRADERCQRGWLWVINRK